MRPKKYLTAKAFVAFINGKWNIDLKLSRFHKDRMKKDGVSVAPEPVARFGNKDLFTEEQAPAYVAKLVTPVQPEAEHEAA